MSKHIAIVDLQEHTGQPASLRVDKEAGVLRGVKLLGWVSANGRRYEPSGVDVRCYEGRPVNANHPARASEQRSIYDRFGRVVNVVKRDDGLYADLEYLRSHPLAGPVTEAAERMPSLLGLSHNARGREERRNGEAVISAVESVVSLDVVADPATVSGLFEARRKTMRKTVRQVLEAAYPARFKALLEMDGDMPDSPDMGAEVEVAPDAAPEDQAAAAFESMLVSVFRSLVAGDMDEAGAVAKVKDILKTYGKLAGKEEAPAEPPAGDAPAAESRTPAAGQLQEQVAALLREKAARKQAAKAGVALTEEQVEDLAAVADDARRARLIEALKPHTTTTPPPAKPLSRGRDLPGTSVTESKAPTDAKALAAWLRG